MIQLNDIQNIIEYRGTSINDSYVNIKKTFNLNDEVERYEKKLIQDILVNSKNQSEAASKLGISPQSLYYKINKYKL